ncbi:hypothetical protein [Pseudomonas sp. GV071]|uniref:hypothetical protein n=1 Tax=Pseudomonas sp. GV071 TaxID=2135754 RepID=UPI000D4659AC|nr:hypothetical protein [Pseudomonas sp. GV071]PTQ69431.1 hypothetical protein C8K61_10876 [Pseudomonas sp. GV071]
MLHEERVTYETLKLWALECYYEGCRDHAVMKGWPHEQTLAYVDYQFESVFERPVEDLMWRVILLVLSGGWDKDWYFRARQMIQNKIVKDGIDNVLVGVPPSEAELFRHDLKVLKLI